MASPSFASGTSFGRFGLEILLRPAGTVLVRPFLIFVPLGLLLLFLKVAGSIDFYGGRRRSSRWSPMRLEHQGEQIALYFTSRAIWCDLRVTT